MKYIFVLFFVLGTVALTDTNAQSNQSALAYNANDPLTRISEDVARTAKAVESLSRSWGEFTRTFTSNQGLQLDERQQKLILALEVMNRLEVSMANMQKLRHDLTERQSGIRLKLATVTDDLQPQSIEKYVALRGTTDAEGLRTIRRHALEREYRELTQLHQQIVREIASTDAEIRRLEVQLRALRNQVFGEAERQLADL
jgi:predicted  nucleic acid-binding Zn-ribbon protein